ncbi:MAG: DUF6505 family protein [Pseudomonadota bacterium]
MKFLKTIRFDPSDMHVFEHAAEQDEWAIPGSFWFSAIEEPELNGKLKQAFSNGFLSLKSFGFSTFTSVAEISQREVDVITGNLAEKFVSGFGAPSIEEALIAANQELEFVIEMCAEVPVNSIFAIRREFDEAGELKERLSLVQAPSEPVHTRVWEIVE